MQKTEIRATKSAGLLGNMLYDEDLHQVFWAYCTGNVIKYQVPIEDFLVKVLDATATYIGDDETQKVIDAAQRIRSLNRAS